MDSLLKSFTKEESNDDEEVVYKLVPWISWNEWNFVRDSLFSSSPDSVAAAFKRISAWKMRGCLPVVIDVTASIIEAQQQDPHIRKDLTDPLVSDNQLAMLYCMAIIRLVNGVVDQDRNKRGKKDKRELSINQAGDEIGLPRKLIDIRHEASHRDLPSLQLLRGASIEALDWIKSHYWDQQKDAIPFQRDQIEVVRKKIKVKLHDLASHLNVKQDSQVGSLPMKRKRNKLSNVSFGRYNPLSIKCKKHQGSHPQGPKNQITRIIRYLFRLYTSSPSEVVAVLLEFLLKASDFSGDNGTKPSDNSGNSKTQTGISDLCRLVITRLSGKEPELILIMLRAVLETLETHGTMKSIDGRDSLTCLQSKAERHQTEQLSSLVLWLIRNYNKVQKNTNGIVHEDVALDSSAEINAVPKVALAELLRKCLVVSSPANSQLARSALLLAQIMGKKSMVERLKKLSEICSSNMDCAEESSQTGFDHTTAQQELSFHRAEEMLELLKHRWKKDNAPSFVESIGDVNQNVGRWTVAKSWNPCPIGMLPGSLGSIGILPVLDKAIDPPEVRNVPERKDSWELNHCGGKKYGSCEGEFLEKTDAIEGTEVEDGDADDQNSLLDPFKGKLMIHGVYTTVHPEELLVIESAVRILV